MAERGVGRPVGGRQLESLTKSCTARTYGHVNIPTEMIPQYVLGGQQQRYLPIVTVCCDETTA